MSIISAMNKNFRKFLLSLFAIVIALSCVGCSKNKALTEPETQTPQTEEVEQAVPSKGVQAQKSTENKESTEAKNADEAANSTQDATSTQSASSELIVRFIDVGEGDSALLTCGGQSLLIDGGPAKASSKVYSVLKTLNLKSLTYIVATHTDADHIGGLSGALTYADVGTFYCSSTSSDTKTFKSLNERLTAKGKSITVPNAQDSFMLGDAKVTFVEPAGTTSKSDNNSSLVLRIQHGEKSFLFEGDAEKEEESEMVSSKENLDADVLKVAHHGSKSSSSTSFLQAVSPQTAVISVGSNSYGHPNSNVIQSLQNVGATVLRTDEQGTIVMKSDGKNISEYSTKGQVNE